MRVPIHINEQLARRLDRIAASSTRSAEAIVGDALTKQLDYEEWFTASVEAGFTSGDEEGWLSHEESKAKLQARITQYKRQTAKAA